MRLASSLIHNHKCHMLHTSVFAPISTQPHHYTGYRCNRSQQQPPHEFLLPDDRLNLQTDRLFIINSQMHALRMLARDAYATFLTTGAKIVVGILTSGAPLSCFYQGIFSLTGCKPSTCPSCHGFIVRQIFSTVACGVFRRTAVRVPAHSGAWPRPGICFAQS